LPSAVVAIDNIYAAAAPTAKREKGGVVGGVRKFLRGGGL